MQEKRKYPRLETSLPITISNPSWDIATETKNISASGAYCAIDRPLEVMTKLDITLLVPTPQSRYSQKLKKIDCEGVVVRNEYIKDNGKHSYRVGIYFSEIKEKDKKTLLAYIDSCLKKDNSKPL